MPQPCSSLWLSPVLGLWPLFLGRKVWGREGKPQARQPTATRRRLLAAHRPGCRREGLRESEGDSNLPSPASLPPSRLTLAQLPAQCTVGMRESGNELPDGGARSELTHVGTGVPSSQDSYCLSSECTVLLPPTLIHPPLILIQLESFLRIPMFAFF